MRQKRSGILRCSLDMKDLFAIDRRIYLEDIKEDPVESTEAADLPGGDGGLLISRNRQRLDITLKIRIKEHEPRAHVQVLQKINAWAAKGGWLRSVDHARQRIFVQCTKPISYSHLDWLEERQITLSAFGLAYWQDDEAREVEQEMESSGSVVITPLGTRPCYLEAEITNTGGYLMTEFSVSANNQSFSFTGISVPMDGTLQIGYDNRHFLFAKVGETHVLGKRLYTSDDHIFLLPLEENTITYSADQACTAKFIARGVYE